MHSAGQHERSGQVQRLWRGDRFPVRIPIPLRSLVVGAFVAEDSLAANDNPDFVC